VTEKDEIIAAREETIHHREDQINESDAMITQCNTIIEFLQEQIHDLILEVDDAQAQINELQQQPAPEAEEEDPEGVLWFNERIVVPKDHELHKQILDEAHLSKFSMHPGSTKMYQDLKQSFWWTRMKREIAKYVSECDICQTVKASHLKTAGNLQPLPIPSWKWEDISMDFIVGLPNTSLRHDSIWVIIDRLTKTAHFLPVHTTYNIKKYAEIYLDQIVRLHGVPKTIISDRGA
jgi:hypothetical protein